MPIRLQRFTFYVLAFVSLVMILYVPIFILTNGVDAVFTTSFGEGSVVEVFGAIGTAVLIVNIEFFAFHAGMTPGKDENDEQAAKIDALQRELSEIKQQLGEIRVLLSPPEET